jgi:hypothetical protein
MAAAELSFNYKTIINGRKDNEATGMLMQPLRNTFNVVCNAMKTLILISAILLGHCSYGQSQNGAVEENYGVSLKKGDSTDISTTTIIHFDSAEVAIFPASYASTIFGRSDQYKDVVFITPDTALVKAALTTLNVQYCSALLKFNRRNWQQTIDIPKADGLWKDLKKIRKQQKERLDRHNKFCPQQQEQLKVKDKQVVAYKIASGDTILIVQTVDFRQDPYKLYQHLATSWIDGWHGWFETNTVRFHYHADKKLLTVNEDL